MFEWEDSIKDCPPFITHRNVFINKICKPYFENRTNTLYIMVIIIHRKTIAVDFQTQGKQRETWLGIF